MRIDNKFSEREKELLEKAGVDVEKDYSAKMLEEIEDIIYDKMMDNLTVNQDFTPLAEEYENILDVIVKIENDFN